MTSKQALARVARERGRAELARRALALRSEPMTRLARGVHPLALTASALAAGLLAGRLIGRPELPRALDPAALVSRALAKSLAGWLETVFSAALAPAPASDDSRADSPPGTQSRSP